jgi:hypothetical protein
MSMATQPHPCPCMEGLMHCFVACKWQLENSKALLQALEITSEQKPLDPELERILNENPWELYE